MGKFKFNKTSVEGVFIIDPQVFADSRGYFMETYNEKDFFDSGIKIKFVQENQSSSKKGVLRGLHYQKNYSQTKLVRVLYGEVYDVAVDLRSNSKTYGKYVGVLISSENKKQLLIPKGFAHGFLVKSNFAEIAYKCDNFYHPEDEGGIFWNDKDIDIKWPIEGEVILSEKDQNYPTLNESKFEFKLKGDD